MNAARASQVGFVALLVAGLLTIAVPAASVAYGFRLETGKPVNFGYGVEELPVTVSNHGFLGVDDVRLQVRVVGDGVVLYSGGIGPVDVPPGGVVPFAVPFVNRSAPSPVPGSLRAEVTGGAVLGGFVPVDLNVTTGYGASTGAAAPTSEGEAVAATALVAAGGFAAADPLRPGGGTGRGSRWSAKGAARGGVAAAIVIVVLVVAPRLAAPGVSGFASGAAGQGTALQLASSFSDFVLGPACAALALALALTEGVLRAHAGPQPLGGALKVAEGVLLGVFFFLLLGGGHVAVDVVLGGLSTRLSVALVLSLVVFELSAAARVAQGVLERRAGARPGP